MSMGTRFMCTKEAAIHINIKNTILNSNENDTTLVMRTLKNTERVFKSPSALKVCEIEKKKPGQISPIRHLVSGINYKESFQKSGNPDSVWSCGQTIGLINDIPSVKELI